MCGFVTNFREISGISVFIRFVIRNMYIEKKQTSIDGREKCGGDFVK
jgi:hypothetical protein